MQIAVFLTTLRKFLLNNCLIFKQITGFDVVTDLFFKIYD